MIPQAAQDHTPAGTEIVGVEVMSPAFTKYHLSDGRALHHFTQAEPHADPHDHPWGFHTRILEGAYREQIFSMHPLNFETGDAQRGWAMWERLRHPGCAYAIIATHIHRIVELPTGECWTLVKAGPWERVVKFWRFGDTIQSRAWNEVEWTDHVA